MRPARRCRHVMLSLLLSGLPLAGWSAAPDAVDDGSSSAPAAKIAEEDTLANFDPLTNDTDEAVNKLDLTGVATADGTAAINANTKTIDFTAATDFFGVAEVVYEITDEEGLTDKATIFVQVVDLDDAPTAVDDGVAVPEDAATDIAAAVLANDSSVDTGEIRFVGATVDVGSVSFTGTSLVYTPPADAFGNGLATLGYAIDDGDGASGTGTDGADDTATVVIDVTQVDDAPRVTDDSATVNEDGTLTAVDVLANDTEVDGGTLAITAVSADVGTATTDGTTVDYTPPADYFGPATVTYTAEDGVGSKTADGTLSITVNPVDDTPAAEDDTVTVAEDSGDTIVDVLANDFLFDAPVTIARVGTTHVIDGESFPNSTETEPTTMVDATGDTVTRPNGVLSIVDGAVNYRPKDDYSGSDFFTYVLEDADGDRATGRVDITITAANDAPTVPAVQNFDVDENGSLNISAEGGLLAPAHDADGDTLTVSLQTGPTSGSLTLNADGSFNYQPDLEYVGDDSFSYFVSDGITTNVGGERTVAIDVRAVSASSTTGSDDELSGEFALAQIPLELQLGVDPNVLVVMDDSGSMDFTLATDEERAVFNLSNRDRSPRPDRVRSESYDYLLPLANNTYDRGGVPAEREMLGSARFRDAPYGVWRARHSAYNRIYYDPTVRYRPWRGLAPDGNAFPDADPNAARLNPARSTDGTMDLRLPYSYRSRDVPEWDDNGGDADRTNEDYYIPRYYRITESGFDGVPAWDTAHELVEIRPEGEAYSSRDLDDGVPVRESVSSGVYPGGPARSDCVDPSACTYAEELQNFANWFVYYRSRESTVKAALGDVVADANGLNIGYATINRDSERERIKPMEASFEETNKRRLLDQIYEIDSSGGTPLRRSLDRAGRHFACRAGDTFGSSAASSPGDGACPVDADGGACQQHFTLLFTDGVWTKSFSGIGNEDSDDPGSDFDGGIFADDESDTLADIAMHYYETDLHALDDLVPTSDRDTALAPDGAFGSDPGTMHQHMTTFTVGFGVSGFLGDEDIPASLDDAATVAWPDPDADDRAKIDDLRHAALNGRGDYLSAADTESLERQLRGAFEEFASGSGAASAVAFNSQQLRSDTLVFRAFYNVDDNTGDLVAQLIDIDGETLVEPPEWSASDRLDDRSPASRVIVTWDREPDAATPSPEGIPFRWADLNSEQQSVLDLDEVAWLRGDRSEERPTGELRQRPDPNGVLGDIVNSTPVFVGPPEFTGRDATAYPVATGDLYSVFATNNADRDGMVYVGANDGMLHGFDADTGDEVFAFVPDRIIRADDDANRIDELVEPDYEHLYFVDGQPAINDVFMTPRGATDREWRTVLVGGLRAGGKGYYAIDVTDPTSFGTAADAAANVLFEFTDEDDSELLDVNGDVILDSDGRPAKDVGYSYSVPTLAMTNVAGSGSGTEQRGRGKGGGTEDLASQELKWAAVFGNGYNATRGKAKLFVTFLEDGADGTWDDGDFVKIDTGFGVPADGEFNAGLPNGLSEPRLVDLDGNGTVDYAYAGDLLGNLFRFDLTSSDPANWTSERIFRAAYADGTPQPITTQPIVTRNPQADGVIVIIATGSYFARSDGASTDMQSLYGIWDRIQANPFSAESAPPTADGDRSLLVEQTLTNVDDAGFGAVRTLSDNAVNYDASTVRGWYIDLDAAPPGGSGVQFPGERAIRNLDLRGGFLFVNTIIPRDANSCEAAPGGFALALDPVSGGGGGRDFQIAFDLDADGGFDDGDRLADGSVVSGLRFDDAVPTDAAFIGSKRFTQLSDRSIDIQETNTSAGAQSGRLSWQEFE